MISIVILAVVALLTVAYYKLRHHYGYFERRGIISPKAFFPFGHVKTADVKESIAYIHQKLYNETKKKSPLFGMFIFTNPIIVPTDLDLIKNILIKDFQYFHDRTSPEVSTQNPLMHHLIFLTGQRWKSLRQRLSPTFTSGKMKFMFPTLVKISREFESTLKKFAREDPVFELKDVIARFSTDVIGECAFGIECNSLKDPDAEFRRMGQKIFTSIKRVTLTRFLAERYPKIMGFLSRHVRDRQIEMTKFFIRTVRETIKYRDENKIRRNDFLDLLLQMRDNKEIGGITFEEIASQVFLFFLGGFETSSTTVSSTMFELVHYTDIQEKLRDEILMVLDRYDNELTYEAVLEMTYLDQVLKETLRLHPPVTHLKRYALNDYQVPDTKIVIEKGMDISIPVYAVHMDPDNYPKPEIFDPERFEQSVAKSRHPSAFLSFGDGPRNCIGERFGLMQSKIAIITLIKNFRLHKSDRYEYPMVVSPSSPVHTIEGGLWLRLEPIN